MSNRSKIFVTGTDTDVGKTVATLGLLRALQSKGLVANGFKPIAAGVSQRECFEGRLLNDDAFLIQQVSSSSLDYSQVNACLLDPPIAPHIAARQVGISLTASESVEQLSEGMQSTHSNSYDVVEGAGGWRVPLNEKEFFSDIAIQLRASVVLVVAIRLGCLNHAQMTFEAIKSDGLKLAGWIANFTEAKDSSKSDIARENISTLERSFLMPPMAVIPFQTDLADLFSTSERRDRVVDRIASYFDLSHLFVET